MSASAPVGRRAVIAGTLGIIGLAIAGGVAYELMPRYRPHYKPTRFDDLLSQLTDRDSAARLGHAVLAAQPHFDPDAAARKLRVEGSFAKAVDNDIAQGKLAEIHGWLLPQSLTELAAIAAQSQ